MNDQVDMRRFGGLWQVMPITFGTFGLGYLAIIGIPRSPGFFTKDAIIEAAFDTGGSAGWLLGIARCSAPALTAFYMTRLFVMTFHGRASAGRTTSHPHESPPSMTVPDDLLAVGSVFAGVLLVRGPLQRLADAGRSAQPRGGGRTPSRR